MKKKKNIYFWKEKNDIKYNFLLPHKYTYKGVFVFMEEEWK